MKELEVLTLTRGRIHSLKDLLRLNYVFRIKYQNCLEFYSTTPYSIPLLGLWIKVTTPPYLPCCIVFFFHKINLQLCQIIVS